MNAAEDAVWMYWEGPVPEYIGICVEAVRRRNRDARLLGPAEWDALWRADRDVADALAPLTPNFRANFVRAYLLHHLGGFWVDADFVCWRDLAELVAQVRGAGKTFCGFREDGRMWQNNFMWAAADSPVAAELYRGVCARLRDRQAPPLAMHASTWWDTGAVPLGRAVARAPETVLEVDYRLVQPIEPHCMPPLLDPAGVLPDRRPGAWGTMLYNTHLARSPAAGWSRAELLTSPSPLGELMRQALR